MVPKLAHATFSMLTVNTGGSVGASLLLT